MKIDDRYYLRRKTMFNTNEIELAKAIYTLWKPRHVFDLGCGIGSHLYGFHECGCKIMGCDYGWNIASNYMDDNVKKSTFMHDASKPLTINEKFDLVTSIEVAEHISHDGSMQFCENMINLANGRIFLTAAQPGQPGNGHINCQKKQFWIDCMAVYGAKFSDYETKLAYDSLIKIDKMGVCKNIMLFKV